MSSNRTPAGVPTGGQFAASARTEATAPLGGLDDTYTDDGRLLRRADATSNGDLLVVPDANGAGRILTVYRIDPVADGLRFTLVPIKGPDTYITVAADQRVEVLDGSLTDEDDEEDLDEWGDYGDEDDDNWSDD